jgi:hypothetical protein
MMEVTHTLYKPMSEKYMQIAIFGKTWCYLQASQSENCHETVLGTSWQAKGANNAHGHGQDNHISKDVGDCVRIPERSQVDAGSLDGVVEDSRNRLALEDGGDNTADAVAGYVNKDVNAD